MGVCLKVLGRWIPHAGAARGRARGLLATAVALLVVWIWLVVNVLGRQPVTAGEAAIAFLAAVVLVVLLAVGAKGVAMMRRPYREWLELEVAG
jgi:hypothetical protein